MNNNTVLSSGYVGYAGALLDVVTAANEALHAEEVHFDAAAGVLLSWVHLFNGSRAI